jgi:hypothetical protein
MAQTIPQQLAAHIDSTCGLHNTGGVAQFFDEDGNLRACQPGESVFAFTIACSLVQYEEFEHDDYKMNVWNMIQGDIDGLTKIQTAVEDFKLPSPRLQVGMNVLWTDPDDGACSGVYKLVGISGEIYSLTNESGSEVEASYHELEVQVQA